MQISVQILLFRKEKIPQSHSPIGAPPNAACPSLSQVERRFSLIRSLGLEPALAFAELRSDGAPKETMHALRLLFGSVRELEGDLRRLAKPASLPTEERAWSCLRSYCKAARATLGASRKADMALARSARNPRRRLALQFRAEKKRLLSELEKRLERLPARSRKAGRVLS